MAIRIMFLDDHLVVVDKPSGVPSVPARTPHDPPDVARVLARGALADTPPPEAVHRLDRDTSGLLVLARTASARRTLGNSFERGAVRKTYVAIVRGQPPAPAGTVHLPLGPDPAQPPRQRVDPVVGRAATTRWWTIASPSPGGGSALVGLEPITGRSHQLRAHLAWLGCPVLGDRLYGGAPDGFQGRLWLHAGRIEFPHPLDGRPIIVAVPLCLDLSEPPPIHDPRAGDRDQATPSSRRR
jgi:tRNA pseudouridine32 synthase/23S rRNA pseudouridine746 synthase